MQQQLQEQANLIRMQQETIASMREQLDYQTQQMHKQEAWIAKLTQVDNTNQYRLTQLEAVTGLAGGGLAGHVPFFIPQYN